MTTLFTNAAQVITCTTADESAVLTATAVAVEDDQIVAVGPQSALEARYPDAERVDCGGGVLTPGLVDSHTHAVFGRWRADEYALRSQGVPYMEIARQGGGINASVRDLRERSEDELVERSRGRLAQVLSLGTTTVEVKSGYGLATEHELKMLRAVRRLDAEGPLDLVPTFLGAHEVPPEYRDRKEAYIDLVIEEMIPAVAEAGLARFCDVFMEPGVFTGEESRRILEAGAAHGLVPKLHADELEASGGAELAAELGAASADHLGAITEAGIEALAGSATTVATLLPGTLFFLGKTTYAPARRLLDAGAEVALATDFNPGSSASPSLPLILTIACSQMGMSPLEALVAATRGGARALRLEDRGTLTVGARADLVVWDTADYREIPYRYGIRLARSVWKGGQAVA